MLKFKNLKQRSINTNNFGSNKDHTKTLKISYSEQAQCKPYYIGKYQTTTTIGQQSQTWIIKNQHSRKSHY